ncbi:unnamed protein product [Arabis nemorensis]|uniref:Uncharacterized protein n=1 Tax=Arabis nemorensis TaxID=586526 RepID=A0A565C569_9BRAS|nr:unnamed protein product [Arabis nemorensis]
MVDDFFFLIQEKSKYRPCVVIDRTNEVSDRSASCWNYLDSVCSVIDQIGRCLIDQYLIAILGILLMINRSSIVSDRSASPWSFPMSDLHNDQSIG